MELQGVLEAYRAMEPVRSIIERIKTEFGADRRWASLEFQAKVMQVVVNDPICDDFAPQRKFAYRFLKSYHDEIEAVQGDADDELVEALMEFVLNPKMAEESLNSEAMHHVSYSIPSADSALVVTCRVASVFNEVGLKLWEAGWLLAEYAIAHESDFRGRNVLELGAGVGFSGMVLACICPANRVVLTDYAPNVMQNLRYNVEINASKFRCPVDVQTLDWDTWQPTDQDEVRPDILLAGDCVYDVASFPSLMRVLQAFLGNDSGTSSQRVAIFASTIRNQETFQAFLDQLAAHYIEYVDITKPALEKMGEQIYSYPNRDQIRLCRLSRSVLDVTPEQD
ncbi:hypothetical protein PHYBOEH_011907 [Phytophthora boehmeriae]|uniref:FAM86 N-terminal domain-containing protein n=1 Tax=Phytophthora boehmeriae TaxID=109152 RepID=A0A8T1X0H1_9STRA|nr:hypothetical protein PHYBOEH_011907 [Phytophthora boehmeriae]